MTPHLFERHYESRWAELERCLDALDRGGVRARRSGRKKPAARGGADGAPAAEPPARAATIAALYRQACEHLAIARERAYPVHLVTRLESITTRAHQHIYRRHDFGIAPLRDLLLHGIPAAVRSMRLQIFVAACVFVLPMIAAGLAAWADPAFLLRLVDVSELRQFEAMYGPDALAHLGRTSGDDWHMFGFYVAHNIGIAFQCFAAGITLGLGTLYFVAFNGLLGGAVAGFLAAHGDAGRFFPFVVTHSAFELTAVVLSGAAGLRLGLSLLAPGRRTRTDALRIAAIEAAPVMVGVFIFLVIAAALEAFWSSAGWIEPVVKYGVGAACWTLVLAYLAYQGRPPEQPADPKESVA